MKISTAKKNSGNLKGILEFSVKFFVRTQSSADSIFSICIFSLFGIRKIIKIKSKQVSSKYYLFTKCLYILTQLFRKFYDKNFSNQTQNVLNCRNITTKLRRTIKMDNL